MTKCAMSIQKFRVDFVGEKHAMRNQMGCNDRSVVVVGAYLKNRKVQKVMAAHLPEK